MCRINLMVLGTRLEKYLYKTFVVDGWTVHVIKHGFGSSLMMESFSKTRSLEIDKNNKIIYMGLSDYESVTENYLQEFFMPFFLKKELLERAEKHENYDYTIHETKYSGPHAWCGNCHKIIATSERRTEDGKKNRSKSFGKNKSSEADGIPVSSQTEESKTA